jgi:DNA-binding PadR family transcriptional regulator
VFRDKPLIPAEAIKLAALGFLADGPRRYGDLAAQIRQFTGRIAAPSLDLMGTSLEGLIVEGLAIASEGKGMADNARLSLTPAGHAALTSLLQTRLKAPLGDFMRLALLLKLRFLHHLGSSERETQMAHIAEIVGDEISRLNELRRSEADAPQPYLDWLDADIAQLQGKLARLGR